MIYNRQEVGMRLRNRRKEMEITAEEMARRIGKNGRYYRDIERGQCGMSVETLILLATVTGLSLDYLVYGPSCDGEDGKLGDQKIATRLLARCNEKTRKGAVDLLKVYLDVVSD